MTEILLSQYSVEKLREMYDECNERCTDSEYPLIITLMKKSANERVQILKESSLNVSLIDSDTINELVSGKYAMILPNQSKLVITAKGLWEVMFRDDVCDVDDLIEGIQSAYFNDIKDVSITSRNKIVLFSMICMRIFSRKCCINVNRSEIADIWWEIFCVVNDFLIELGVIKEKDSIKKDKKKVNNSENEAVNIIRHSDRIPRYTDNLFLKSGELEYWLNLSDLDGKVDAIKLSKLIKKVLGEYITADNCDTIADFANNVCMDYGYKFMSSFDDVQYLSSSYDSMINYAFQKSLM